MMKSDRECDLIEKTDSIFDNSHNGYFGKCNGCKCKSIESYQH